METMLQAFGIVMATHPLQVAMMVVALFYAIRTTLRESASWKSRRRPIVIVGATTRRAAVGIPA